MHRIALSLLLGLLVLAPTLNQAAPLPAPTTVAAFPSESYQLGYDNGVSDAQYFADAYANGSISYASYLYNVDATRARAEQLREEAPIGSDDWAYFNGYLDGFH